MFKIPVRLRLLAREDSRYRWLTLGNAERGADWDCQGPTEKVRGWRWDGESWEKGCSRGQIAAGTNKSVSSRRTHDEANFGEIVSPRILSLSLLFVLPPRLLEEAEETLSVESSIEI